MLAKRSGTPNPNSKQHTEHFERREKPTTNLRFGLTFRKSGRERDVVFSLFTCDGELRREKEPGVDAPLLCKFTVIQVADFLMELDPLDDDPAQRRKNCCCSLALVRLVELPSRLRYPSLIVVVCLLFFIFLFFSFLIWITFSFNDITSAVACFLWMTCNCDLISW